MMNNWKMFVWWRILSIHRLCAIPLVSSNLQQKFKCFKELVGMSKPKIKVAIMHLRVFFFRLTAVLMYSFFGATVFYHLEQQEQKKYGRQRANISHIINNVKWRLHENISSLELNRISQELSKLVSEIYSGNGTVKGTTEQYFNWVYFCLTTIMTIGKFVQSFKR